MMCGYNIQIRCKNTLTLQIAGSIPATTTKKKRKQCTTGWLGKQCFECDLKEVKKDADLKQLFTKRPDLKNCSISTQLEVQPIIKYEKVSK